MRPSSVRGSMWLSVAVRCSRGSRLPPGGAGVERRIWRALLPTVHGDPGMGAQGALILSQPWQAMTVHLNGQFVWTRAHEPGGFGGLILEGPDAWPVRPVAEIFVEGERGSPTTRSALLGGIWRVRDWLSFDLGVRGARVGGDAVAEIRLGLTWAFALGAGG